MPKNLNKSILNWCSVGLILGLMVAFPFGFIGNATAKTTLVTSAKVSGDISSAIGFSVTSTQNPYRVIIDLADANFDLPPGVGRNGAGLVTAFRYGFVEEHKSRIVLDLSGPVLIGRSIVVPTKKKHPAHILVEMIQTTPENFQAAFLKDHPETIAGLAEQTAAITPVVPPIITKPMAQISNAIKTIVIDAGHGGVDPGASSPKGTREKDVVLAFAKTLRDSLQTTGRYKVVMTRDDDQFVALEDRVKIARENKADLFVVIHADTVKQVSVRGTTVYTVSDKASDAEAETAG